MAAVILAAGSASAAGPGFIVGNTEGDPSAGGDRVYIESWTPDSNVTFEVWDSTAKTTLVESATGLTDSNGNTEVSFTDLKVGQFVIVDGGGLTRDLELSSVTGAIDVFTDKVAGTAPPGAQVVVDAATCRVTVADAGGMWEVDFSVLGSGDCTDIHSFGLGDAAGVSAGDGDGDFTQIDIEVHDFTDDNGHTFEMDITWMYQEGITKGCNPPVNDLYCPEDYVTRGQMAAFLVRALKYTDAGAGDLFTDDDGLLFESAIDKLATAGVTKGCNPPDNDLFCPNDNVTRGQMAAFLRRALG